MVLLEGFGPSSKLKMICFSLSAKFSFLTRIVEQDNLIVDKARINITLTIKVF